MGIAASVLDDEAIPPQSATTPQHHASIRGPARGIRLKTRLADPGSRITLDARVDYECITNKCSWLSARLQTFALHDALHVGGHSPICGPTPKSSSQNALSVVDASLMGEPLSTSASSSAIAPPMDRPPTCCSPVICTSARRPHHHRPPVAQERREPSSMGTRCSPEGAKLPKSWAPRPDVPAPALSGEFLTLPVSTSRLVGSDQIQTHSTGSTAGISFAYGERASGTKLVCASADAHGWARYVAWTLDGVLASQAHTSEN